MNKSLFKVFTLMTSLPLLWMPTAVLADDNKVYPGSACVPLSPVFGGLFIVYEQGTILNTGQDPISVDCLIVRDNTTNTNGLGRVEVRVEADPSSSLSCNLRSFDPIGNQLDEFRQLSNPVLGTQSLEMRLNTSARLGNYQLQCELPSGSRILSYLVIEP